MLLFSGQQVFIFYFILRSNNETTHADVSSEVGV